MYPHRIRLGPPWERGPSDPIGRARWVRHFGYPRSVDAYERIWIVWSHPTVGAALTLNGRPLGLVGAHGFEAPADRALLIRNELTIDLPVGQILAGEVALEIRRTAYLSGVTVEPGAVSGELVGAAGPDDEVGPFEVYVLAGGQTAGYTTVEPDPAGRPFRVECPELSGPARVELVKGGSVWYAWEGG
jgi:hypothetical protein